MWIHREPTVIRRDPPLPSHLTCARAARYLGSPPRGAISPLPNLRCTLVLPQFAATADGRRFDPASRSRLQAVTKITALRLSMGMEALQNIASEMDGNLESMPSPAAKVVFKAMNVNKSSHTGGSKPILDSSWIIAWHMPSALAMQEGQPHSLVACSALLLCFLLLAMQEAQPLR